jgi:hypothetical protein
MTQNQTNQLPPHKQSDMSPEHVAMLNTVLGALAEKEKISNRYRLLCAMDLESIGELRQRYVKQADFDAWLDEKIDKVIGRK